MICDICIEAPFDEASYRTAFADAFGLRHGALTFTQGGEYPEPGSCDAFVWIWPITGDYPVRATIFVLAEAADLAAQEAEATGAAWQFLADSLGCGVCASSDHPEPWLFLVYRPGVEPTLVEVDIDTLDDDDRLSMKPPSAPPSWPRP